MADFDTRHGHQSPPTYQEALETAVNQANVRDDGRIDVDLNSRLSRTISKIMHPATVIHKQEEVAPPEYSTLPQFDTFSLKLNIVIQVVGSRGDVQPFVALGHALRKHGHRVRLATHEKFRAFVQDAGLEFFPIGGDPEDLMAYMVKNPGLVPSMKSLRAGDIARKRQMVAEMLEGCWKSCIEVDDTTGIPFVADAIIANPPSFAHIHCAEALGIPVHIVFTMPWTATSYFAHPLANIRGTSTDTKYANYITYALVEWMTLQGLGDIINEWRHKLDLETVPMTEGPMLAQTLKVPHTYCWSPALVPKPADWAEHVNVSGFFFRESPEYKPPKDLEDFLAAGSPPVYVGFGSIVVEDAASFSSAIVDALTECGVRAIISPGWSKLQIPDSRPDIFKVEECPHEWLFQHVSMVIHHGGAGTTAIGLREARPTIIVPFFGDQPFWANMVASAGAGPKPIPQREISARRLAEAIQFCQSEDVQNAAATISAQIRQEDGVQAAVRSFHANLPLERMRCEVLPDQPASWQMKLGGKRINMSRSAAEVLVHDAGLNAKHLKPYLSYPILITNRRWDPATGTISAVIGTYADLLDGATGVFLKPGQELRRGRSANPAFKTRSVPGSSSSSPVPRSASALPSDVASLRKQDSDLSSLPSPEPGKAESFTTDYPSTLNQVASAPLNATSTSSTASSSPSKAASSPNVAGKMALASTKSFGKFFGAFSKGFLVDIPLATTEGFRSLPRLWGEEVRDYGSVTDWQTGGIVAGKTLVQGLSDGCRDFVELPAKAAREGGWLGAVRGVGMGSGSLVSKGVAGGLGLVAYPGQGLVKSLHAWTHTSTRKRIAEARREEGKVGMRGLDEGQSGAWRICIMSCRCGRSRR